MTTHQPTPGESVTMTVRCPIFDVILFQPLAGACLDLETRIISFTCGRCGHEHEVTKLATRELDNAVLWGVPLK